MRWAPTSRLEHSNQELLALYLCRDVAVFVVPGGLRGVPPESQWRARWSQGRPRGARVVPRGPKSVPGGSQGISGLLQGRPGRPWAPFHKDDSVISFHNIIP